MINTLYTWGNVSAIHRVSDDGFVAGQLGAPHFIITVADTLVSTVAPFTRLNVRLHINKWSRLRCADKRSVVDSPSPYPTNSVQKKRCEFRPILRHTARQTSIFAHLNYMPLGSTYEEDRRCQASTLPFQQPPPFQLLSARDS